MFDDKKDIYFPIREPNKNEDDNEFHLASCVCGELVRVY